VKSKTIIAIYKVNRLSYDNSYVNLKNFDN